MTNQIIMDVPTPATPEVNIEVPPPTIVIEAPQPRPYVARVIERDSNGFIAAFRIDPA